MMNERIRHAFGQVRAEPALKRRTLAMLEQRTRGFSRPVRRRSPALTAAAALLTLVLLGAGGSWWYLTPVSAISIDSAASLELSLNRLDRVVAVQGFDEAGCALADELELTHLTYTQALETVLDSAGLDGGQEGLSISVLADSEQKSQALLTGVRACAGEQPNVHCSSGDPQLLSQAHGCGLSYGRYQALLLLQQLDSSITAEQVQGLSMHELRSWIAALSEDGSSGGDTLPSGNGASGGQRHHGQSGHHTGG